MGEHRKVMVVDDDLMSVMETEQALEETDYDVVRLSTASGALSKIDYEQPDALLVDITMDRLNAEDLIETLRGSPEHSNVVVVVYSDMDADSLKEYCEEHDVNGYFRKSMDTARISEFFDRLFG